MSGQGDSGDKTEEPTDKKLKDARKKGQVAKSKDLTSTVELVVWLVLAWLALGWTGSELVALFKAAMALVGQPFELAAPTLATQSLRTLLALTAGLLLPSCAVGLLVEYLQVGPLLSFEKLTPKYENLDPVGGFKRMFSLSSWFELVKSVIKTSALFIIGWLAVVDLIPQLIKLPWAGRPDAVGLALWGAAKPVLTWTISLFALLSVLDAVHQRWSFRKKMRMSMRDIKQEHKEAEGDPHVKGMRKQLAHEWAQQGAAQSARKANALVVNPTHVAIAIEYDREICPIPTVLAKGQDDIALAMREAAEGEGVPILRNVALARDLLARAEEGDVIPADLFDVVAEVILWAKEVREHLMAAQAEHPAPDRQPTTGRRREPPGEDLTRYPAAPAPQGATVDEWPPTKPH